MGIVKMASNLSRLFLRGGNVLKNFTVTSGVQRTLSVSAIRSKEYELPDGLEHATGLEKYEYQKELEGNDDPLFMRVRNRSDYKGIGVRSVISLPRASKNPARP